MCKNHTYGAWVEKTTAAAIITKPVEPVKETTLLEHNTVTASSEIADTLVAWKPIEVWVKPFLSKEDREVYVVLNTPTERYWYVAQNITKKYSILMWKAYGKWDINLGDSLKDEMSEKLGVVKKAIWL